MLVSGVLAGGALAQDVDLVLNHDVIGPTTINASETATFEVTIENTDPTYPGDAADVVLTYEISETDTLVSAIPTQGSCGAPDANNVFTCSLGTIAHGNTVTVGVIVRGTGIGATPPYTMTTNAVVTTSSNDVDPTNDEQERTVTVNAGTDLGIQLDSSPVSVASGGIWSHNITVENFGPIAATGIVVHLDLPGGAEVSGGLPAGCSLGGPGVVCNLANLALGAQHTFGAIEAQVAAAAGSNLSAVASINSLDQVDGNADNNSDTQQVAVTAGSDVSVNLSSPGGVILENEPFNLTANTQYTGEVPDLPITMTITLDPGLAFQDADPVNMNGWSCTKAGPELECNYPNIAGLVDGNNQTLGQVTVGVVGAAAGTYTNNSAAISSNTGAKPDPNPSNNSDSTSVTITEANLDLRMRKTAPEHHLRTIGAAYPFSYEVRIRNHGNVGFWGELEWTENVPLGLTVTSIDTPAGWSCTPASATGANTIDCSRTIPQGEALAPGSNLFFTINAYANGDVEGNVVNQACLTIVDHDEAFLTNEGNQDCNTATINAQTEANSADLQVLKTADLDPVTAGEALTYTLEIVNAGPAIAESVTLTDTLNNLFTQSGGNSFQGVVVNDNSATGGTCGTSGNPGNPSSRTLTCNFSEIPVCTQGVDCPTIEITILPLGAEASGVAFTRPNTASAFSSVTADPNYGNNTGNVNVEVDPQTDLELEKTVTTWTGELGTPLNYRVQVRNVGASGASTLEMTDTLPHDVVFLGVDPGGSGATCATQPAIGSTTDATNEEIVCTRPALPRGANWNIDIQTRPNHGIPAGTVLVNSAEVTTATTETDLNNNDDTANATVGEAVVDLATVKTDNPDPVFAGDIVTYTVQVTNNGPSVAESATIYDFLPSAGFRFVAGSVTFYNIVGGTLDPIADPGALGISCSKLPAGNAFGTGYPANPLNYLWPMDVATNPDYLDGVWNPAAGDLENDADIICDMGLLENGQARAIRYEMEADARGVYFHHAISRSQEHRDNLAAGPDPQPSNDVTRERTTVRSPIPSLAFDKVANTSSGVDNDVNLLEPFSYTLTLTNTGVEPASFPQIRDELPAGMQLTAAPVLVSGAPSGSSCTGGYGDTEFVCSLGSALPQGGEVVLEIPVRIVSGADGATLTNTAEVYLDTDLTFDDEQPVRQDDETVTLVVPSGVSIAGRVFLDVGDTEEFVEGTDSGIADQTIELWRVNSSGDFVDDSNNPTSDPIHTTVTDGQGYFSFTGLPVLPGDGSSYILRQPNQPSGTRNGVTIAGTVAGTTVGTTTARNELPSEISGIVLDADGMVSIDNLFAEIPAPPAGTPPSAVEPDLVLIKTAHPSVFFAGGTASYTLVARNIGATPTDGTITVVDTLPDGITLSGAATGSGWSCNSAGQIVSCSTEQILNTSQSATPISLPVNVSTTLDGQTVTNVARVDGGGESPNVRDNNEAEVTTPVTGERASLEGHVWRDLNHDRVLDPNEPRLPGWTVELYRDGELLDTRITNENGFYRFTNLMPGEGYEVRFRDPDTGHLYGRPVPNEQGLPFEQGVMHPSNNLGGAVNVNGVLSNLTLVAGRNTPEQSLPLDPAGVVYDSDTRLPVPNAEVTLFGPPGSNFDPAIHVVGGEGSLITGEDGFYQFLLLPGAPEGEYRLEITRYPSGYIQRPSEVIPVCEATLVVGPVPDPALMQSSSEAPQHGVPLHDPQNCEGAIEGGSNSTQHYFSFILTAASSDVVNNHLPIDPYTDAIWATKTSPKVNVTQGELVPYRITATNTENYAMQDVVVVDELPPGFQYVQSSARLNGVPIEPEMDGRRLRWTLDELGVEEMITLDLLLVAGVGLGANEYENQAWTVQGITGARLSNIATSTVRIIPDPVFECTDIIGQVFDDQNRDGYQNEGEPGIAGVRLVTPRGWEVTTDEYGQFNMACVDVPNILRGANFILKLDERSLPSGYRVTTENPRVTRITQGRVTKLNFGAAIHRVVRVDLTAALFNEDNSLVEEHAESLLQVLPILHEEPSVLRLAYHLSIGGDRSQAEQRIAEVRAWLKEHWQEQECCYDLLIEEELVAGAETEEVNP